VLLQNPLPPNIHAPPARCFTSKLNIPTTPSDLRPPTTDNRPKCRPPLPEGSPPLFGIGRPLFGVALPLSGSKSPLLGVTLSLSGAGSPLLGAASPLSEHARSFPVPLQPLLETTWPLSEQPQPFLVSRRVPSELPLRFSSIRRSSVHGALPLLASNSGTDLASCRGFADRGMVLHRKAHARCFVSVRCPRGSAFDLCDSVRPHSLNIWVNCVEESPIIGHKSGPIL
jgi:hypothetical protein